MADFVDNTLTIRCKDIEQKQKIKKVLFKENDKNEPVLTMTKLLPRPKGFDNNPCYSEFGYDWSCSVWGTKWDVEQIETTESGNSISITYRTAWNPNLLWTEALCRFIDSIAFTLDKQKNHEIRVSHFFVKEYEDIGVLMTWNPIDDEYNYTENISYGNHIYGKEFSM